MSDPETTPDERRPILPEEEDVVERADVPSYDAEIPDEALPETQADDPLLAALGDDGQGDLAPEDEPDVISGDAPDDLRDGTA